jgi:hypothetical protein
LGAVDDGEAGGVVESLVAPVSPAAVTPFAVVERVVSIEPAAAASVVPVDESSPQAVRTEDHR